MPVIRGAPTGTARQWGSQLLSQAQGLGGQAVNLQLAQLQTLRDKRDRLLQGLALLRQREDRKKAIHQQNRVQPSEWLQLAGDLPKTVASVFDAGANIGDMFAQEANFIGPGSGGSQYTMQRPSAGFDVP